MRKLRPITWIVRNRPTGFQFNHPARVSPNLATDVRTSLACGGSVTGGQRALLPFGLLLPRLGAGRNQGVPIAILKKSSVPVQLSRSWALSRSESSLYLSLFSLIEAIHGASAAWHCHVDTAMMSAAGNRVLCAAFRILENGLPAGTADRDCARR